MSLTVRIDPHVHSEASYDGHDPVDLILEHAADIGLDAVVITDHDVMHASLEAAERASEYGLVGIPGVEVSTKHGHLLALGVEQLPPRGEPLDETVAWVRRHGGVAIVPHPFQRSRHGVRKRHFTDTDAVEVYNSWLFTGYKNRRARRFADKRGYPRVAGSDAHHVGFVGRAYTEIGLDGLTREELTADHVLDAIKNGSTSVEGRRTPVRVSTKHYMIAAGRKSGYYAKRGALASGRTAARGAFSTARLLYRLSPLSK